MAPQKEKKPKDAEKNNGINKYFSAKDGKKDKGESLERLEQGMNDGTISREKINAGLQQSVIKDHTGQAPINSEQSSRSKNNATEEVAPHQPPHFVISEPNETEDVDMQYLEPKTADQNHPRSVKNGISPEAEEQLQKTPAHQGSSVETEALQDEVSTPDQLEDGCLAVLTPKEKKAKGSKSSGDKEYDEDVVIDGWGTLNGSSFVIIQDGPFKYASYRFERRKGYSDPDKVYISDEAARISRLKDKEPSGKMIPRYTRENFVGIYGIVCSNGKRKSTWMKVKWKNIGSGDDENLVRGCSWEPKTELVRFWGGKKASEEKTNEIWENQKKRFADYQKGVAPKFDSQGRSVYERSPTPCPPDMTIDQYRQDRKEKQDRDAAKIKTETPNGFRRQADNLQSDKSAIKTKEEFMEQKMKGDEWEKLSDLDKEKRKVELEALYDVYLETVRSSGDGPSHKSENTPIPVS
ncbi:hypothetical protein N7509_000180 [Penicillium cosmopolitanum]|uniref:Uncharacterized protein n=1 Tax=Penicillium cosmopolitanum TaxID=1131564 RepID=A0A9W9WCC6_9EURO|nr:uncharacterized protein N7509_000180 [Penicillium cosmopolitanum]KAJ5414846.1 hypothetical protein N7509_000180 [Penicillium cosmopolitanum]